MMTSDRKKNIFGAIFYLCFGIFILIGLLGTDNMNRGDISQADLVSIEGHLLKNPVIGKIGKGNSPQLEIRLKEYAEIRFNNFGVMYNEALAQKALDSLKEGDLVILRILRYDYETKLAKIKSRNFFEKFSDPSDHISMYGIIKNTNDFVDFKSLQSDLRTNVPIGRNLGWLAFVVFFVLGVVKLFQGKGS